MKKPLVLALCFAISGFVTAAMPASSSSQSCFMTRVRSSSGASITLTTGYAYLVVPGQDRITAWLWRPLDRVQVCRGRGSISVITNLTLPRAQTIMAIKWNALGAA